ncbi:MAG: GNAT family N-acetyltransferase [Hyphomicrobiaceae bacterium]
MLIIRAARWSDHAELKPIVDAFAEMHSRWDPGFRSRWLGFTAAIFQTWLQASDEFHLVAVRDGKVVGYTSGGKFLGNDGIHLFSRRNIFVYTLVVAETERGQGIGRKLFAAIEDQAREHDAEIIQLNVTTANTDAKAFYDKLGYVSSSETRTKVVQHVKRYE